MRAKPINDCPVPKGTLVIIGGKENRGEPLEKQIQYVNSDRLEVLKSYVALLPKGNRHIAVVTTASGLPDDVIAEYKKAFNELGIKSIDHIHHNTREEAIKDDVKGLLEKTAGGFFTGGDQLKLTTLYGGTRFLISLKQKYIRDNFVIGGTSAGAMAMSTPMIYAGNQEVQQISGSIKITTGLEFLKDVCIDTHFVDRGRFVRMAQVIATNPTCVGVGIEEDTAIIVKKGIEAEVCGSGIVTIIEGTEITQSNILDFGKEDAVSIRNMKVHLLSKGDTFFVPQNNPPHI